MFDHLDSDRGIHLVAQSDLGEVDHKLDLSISISKSNTVCQEVGMKRRSPPTPQHHHHLLRPLFSVNFSTFYFFFLRELAVML